MKRNNIVALDVSCKICHKKISPVESNGELLRAIGGLAVDAERETLVVLAYCPYHDGIVLSEIKIDELWEIVYSQQVKTHIKRRMN